MYRLGIIEESIDDRDILCILTPYFVSQRIENVPEDECPVWHINEYHVADDKIIDVAEMLKQHIKKTWYCHAFSDKKLLVRRYLETIPLHI